MADESGEMHVSEYLLGDLRGFTEDEDIWSDFLTFVWGNEYGRAPGYAAISRTVWRVEGGISPMPEVDYFDWGGEHLMLANLRIWYVRTKDSLDWGIGAFGGGRRRHRLGAWRAATADPSPLGGGLLDADCIKGF